MFFEPRPRIKTPALRKSFFGRDPGARWLDSDFAASSVLSLLRFRTRAPPCTRELEAAVLSHPVIDVLFFSFGVELRQPLLGVKPGAIGWTVHSLLQVVSQAKGWWHDLVLTSSTQSSLDHSTPSVCPGVMFFSSGVELRLPLRRGYTNWRRCERGGPRVCWLAAQGPTLK